MQSSNNVSFLLRHPSRNRIQPLPPFSFSLTSPENIYDGDEDQESSSPSFPSSPSSVSCPTKNCFQFASPPDTPVVLSYTGGNLGTLPIPTLTTTTTTTNNTSNTNNTQDTVTFDIAILSSDYSPIEVTSLNKHVIDLDDILIDLQTFRTIFYPHGETFGIIDKSLANHSHYFPYITFNTPHRSIHNGQPFSLLEHIIMNIENDLNVTRNCFTTTTLLQLSKELSDIKTLVDMNTGEMLGSLPWSNVKHMIKNDYFSRTSNNLLKQIVLVISIVFKTPHALILPTVIKFKYRMNLDNSMIV